MAIACRYADFGESERARTFIDAHWSPHHAYVRMPELFEWTFGRKALWDRDAYSFAFAEDRGDIVGILGGIPFLFNSLGIESRGVWLVNFMLMPEYRRGAGALQLLNMFKRVPYETTIAFGNDARVVPLYRALGAQILPEMPRHLLVLPTATARMADLICQTSPDWPRARAERLARAFSLHSTSGPVPEWSTSLPPTWDRCDWPRIAAATVGAARNADYLTWRYATHPVFDYRFITIQDGNRTGLLVWRLETIRRSTPEGLQDVDRIGRVVEYLPTSAANARDLLTALLQALVEADAIAADYYAYHGQTRSWLSEIGFHDVAIDVDGRAIPSRFQPLDGRGGDIQSAVFAPPHVPLCRSDAQSPWHWTKSDSDQDRPN